MFGEGRDDSRQTVMLPARVGDFEADIDTPALIVDLDHFEANLARASALLAVHPGVAIRPHFKSNKCVELTRRQLAAHAAQGVTVSGVCAQTPETVTP